MQVRTHKHSFKGWAPINDDEERLFHECVSVALHVDEFASGCPLLSEIERAVMGAATSVSHSTDIQRRKLHNQKPENLKCLERQLKSTQPGPEKIDLRKQVRN